MKLDYYILIFYPILLDVLKWLDYEWLEINMKWGKKFKLPATSYLVGIYCVTNKDNLIVILSKSMHLCVCMCMRATSSAWQLCFMCKNVMHTKVE